MASMKVERDVNAAPGVVWAIITDLDRSVDVISAIDSIERAGGPSGFGVGTRWLETRQFFGKEATETLEVAAVDEGRSYTVTAEGHGVEYTTIMAVEPSGEGSRLMMSFEGRAVTLTARIGALLGRFFAGSTRKMLMSDLDDIAAAAEEEASAA
jgi:carbon monoxide dehydrogenase subunit G